MTQIVRTGPDSGTGIQAASVMFFQIVPRRARLLEPREFFSWSYPQRVVYSLVDGKRSVEVMARLLRQDPEKVLPIVADMLSKGILNV